jgi:cysteinyl-tRNA synthetase
MGRKSLNRTEDEIRELLDQRAEARKARNFKLADEIRDKLLSWGILIEDGPKGSSWRVKE